MKRVPPAAAALLALSTCQLVGCGQGPQLTGPWPAGANPAFVLTPGSPALASRELPVVSMPAPAYRVAAATATTNLDGKVLVLAGDGQEADLPAIQQLLERMGTPFDLWIASQHPNALTADKLANGGHGLYQGVILTTGQLPILVGGNWVSALSSAEWQALWGYEASFNVRQISWYTYPNADYGFGPAQALDTSTTPLSGSFTAAGRSAFASLNTANGLPIANAYTYLAKPLDAGVTPWLSDAAGHALVALKTYPDGRQNLALTFDSNPALIHTQALAFGLVNWLTGGVFLGDRRTAVCEQVDDLFIDDDMWVPGGTTGIDRQYTAGESSDPAPTFRITGADLQRFASWQGAKRRDPLLTTLKTSLAFNGYGTTQDFLADRPKDTLIPAARLLQGEFFWISHTFNHQNLDATDRATTTAELVQNNLVAARLGLKAYSGLNLVQPDVSGLYSAVAMQAAYDTGVRFVVSDTSHPDQLPTVPNTGLVNARVPGIFELPRHPVNLFYNVSTPAEWVSEYNHLYNAFWGRDLDYAEILDKTSDQLAAYLLAGDLDPWMFHQPNLRAYDGTHSLLGDLTDRTLAKYGRVFATPIWFPSQDRLGQYLQDRGNYLAAGVTASIVPGHSISLSAKNACSAPLIGPRTVNAVWVHDHWATDVKLAAGQTLTFSLVGVGQAP